MKLHSKNLLSLFGFDALNRVLAFSSTAYLARVLGNEGFGVINFGLAVLAYGVLFSSLGLQTIGTRMVAPPDSHGRLIVRRITLLRLCLSIPVIIFIVVMAIQFSHSAAIQSVVLLYAASLFPMVMQIEWYFQGKEQIAVIGINRAVASVVFFLGVIVVVRSPADVHLVPITFFLGSCVNTALLFGAFTRTPQQHDGLSADDPALHWRPLLRTAIPVGLASVLSQVVFNLPLLLLGAFAPTAELGNYGAASKSIYFLLAIDRAIYFLVFPLAARTHSTNPEALPPQMNRILKYTLILAIPVAVGGAVTARELFSAIYGPGYENASLAFQVLCSFFLFTVLNSLFAYLLIAVGKEKSFSSIVTNVSVLMVIGLVPLTYAFKATGAATGLAIGEFCVMMLMYREAAKVARLNFLSSAMKPFFASLIMAGAVYWMLQFGLIAAIGSGVFVYGASILLTKGFSTDDLNYLRERFI